MKIDIAVGTIDDVVRLSAQIPEFDRAMTQQSMEQRLAGKRDLILVASDGQTLVGYKVGYSLNDDTFYSWVGGVTPQYRGKGIASLLLKGQEKWALESGFKTIRVKSMNRYPTMLKLLISNRYQITGMETVQGKEDKILFSKNLVEQIL